MFREATRGAGLFDRDLAAGGKQVDFRQFKRHAEQLPFRVVAFRQHEESIGMFGVVERQAFDRLGQREEQHPESLVFQQFHVVEHHGSEFSNPRALEMDPQGCPRTRVFYCDPRATNQKSRIERNHELVRTVLPKGASFDELTQADVDRMLSHVNSYSRPSLNDKAPFDLFDFLYGADILAGLGLCRIPSNEIVLRPELLD